MAATDGLCSVADGGAKRLSDFVVDPRFSFLRRLSLPGFPLLPCVTFRLSRASSATLRRERALERKPGFLLPPLTHLPHRRPIP